MSHLWPRLLAIHVTESWIDPTSWPKVSRVFSPPSKPSTPGLPSRPSPPRTARRNPGARPRGVHRYTSTPHEHVVGAWLTLSPADGVVSHISALELHDLTDLTADQVHVTLPRDKRDITVPSGVHAHFSARPVTGRDRRIVHGIPITSIERTLTHVLCSTGWTEQTSEAITHALARGRTTAKRLTDALPAPCTDASDR